MNRNRPYRRWLACLLAPGLGCAQASTVEYDALEQLFGEPVTTSVTGVPQRISDVPASMIVITAEDIRRSGARDIPGVLKHAAGMDIMQWNSEEADVSTRGYNQAYSPRMLVLVDGRQVYSYDYGFTRWSTVPVELAAIRQIEIVKGPNSALFGFNAVNGVINIVTQDMITAPVDQVSTTLGTQDLRQASLIRSFKLGPQAGFRFMAGGHRNSDFDTPIPSAMGSVDRIEPRRAIVDLSGHFHLGDNIQLGFSANHAHVEQNAVGPNYQYSNVASRRNSVHAWGSADTDAGLLKLSAYTNSTHDHVHPGLGDSEFDFENRTDVVELQDLIALAKNHSLRATLEYRHTEAPTTPEEGGSIHYKVFASALMWQWQISPSLSWSNALRVDLLRLGRNGDVPDDYPLDNGDWNRRIRETSFNSGLVWRAGDRDTLRLNVGRGVLMPNLVGLGGLLYTSETVNVSGTPTLQPTPVQHLEAAWDRDLAGIGGTLRSALFAQRSQNLLSIFGGVQSREDGAPYFTGANIGDSSSYGLELALDGRSDTLGRWGVSYRFVRLDDDLVPGFEDGSAALDFEHSTPRHLLKLRLGRDHGPWAFDGFLVYQSATQGLEPAQNSGSRTQMTPIGAWLSFDARIAYRLNEQATLSLSGQNLIDARQRQTSGPDLQRRVFLTLSVDF